MLSLFIIKEFVSRLLQLFWGKFFIFIFFADPKNDPIRDPDPRNDPIREFFDPLHP